RAANSRATAGPIQRTEPSASPVRAVGARLLLCAGAAARNLRFSPQFANCELAGEHHPNLYGGWERLRTTEWRVSSMAVAATRATFSDYHNAVDSQIEMGATFGQLEDFIDACQLDDEEKAALWLWAWRAQPDDVRRSFRDAE